MVTERSFLAQVTKDHTEYYSDEVYNYGMGRIDEIFSQQQSFSKFLATNVMRWIKENGIQISELKEFAIRWGIEDGQPIYDTNLTADKASFDMLVRIGIPLTPNNMLDLLGYYGVKLQKVELPMRNTILSARAK